MKFISLLIGIGVVCIGCGQEPARKQAASDTFEVNRNLGRRCTEPIVYVLLVFDTQADKIGESINVQRSTFPQAINDAFNKAHLTDQLRLTILSDDSVTVENIRAFFRKHQLHSDDAILFYYQGYCGINQKGDHFLTMNSGELFRKEIKDMALNAKPRLAVILTDSVLDYSEKSNELEGYNRQDHSMTSPMLDLLLNSKGVVDVNCCMPGQGGRINKMYGAFWTAGITSRLYAGSLNNNAESKMGWKELFKMVDADVDKLQEALPADKRQKTFIFEMPKEELF